MLYLNWYLQLYWFQSTSLFTPQLPRQYLTNLDPKRLFEWSLNLQCSAEVQIFKQRVSNGADLWRLCPGPLKSNQKKRNSEDFVLGDLRFAPPHTRSGREVKESKYAVTPSAWKFFFLGNESDVMLKCIQSTFHVVQIAWIFPYKIPFE